MAVISDRTGTIRASVRDVQHELVFAVALVVMVTFLFLRNISATIIPSIVVPLSLVGTFGVMYLAGFSVNNLTLMALTIATGFVVDDAIVMVENIARHLEEGATPMKAALAGAKEIGFTLVSLTISLIAVLIPLLFMADVVGRLFREFAITLAVSILISLVVSLTLTPMMSAPAAASPDGSRAGLVLSPHAARSSTASSTLTAGSCVGAAAPAGDAARGAADAGADRRPLRRGAEGVLPGAGHRRHPGDHGGAAVGVVLGDGRAAARRGPGDPEGAGRHRPVVVHRRGRQQSDAEQRPDADHPGAARANARARRPRSSRACGSGCSRCLASPCTCSRCRI